MTLIRTNAYQASPQIPPHAQKGKVAAVERLYHTALTRPIDERAAFLAEACAGDEALRREVESPLAQGVASKGALTGRRGGCRGLQAAAEAERVAVSIHKF